MSITLVARESKKPTGLVRYSQNLIKELLKLDSKIKAILFHGKEIKILNRKMGGIMYICLKLLSTKFDGKIVHSLNLHPVHPKINVITLHDLTALHRGKGERFMCKYFVLNRLKYMEKIITPTNYVAEVASYMSGVDRDKFTKIHYGINHEIFYPSNKVPLEVSKDKYNLLYVGEVRRRKNVHIILEAVSLLGDEYRLIKIGPDVDINYKEECIKISNREKIDFVDIGYLPGNEIRNYYSNVDLLIFPSSEEGFGLPPLEAMACGTNSVVSDIPVFREIYQDNVFYSEIDAYDLADKIEYAIKHKKRKEDLINYAKRFSWEKAAKETYKIYEEIKE